MSLSKTCMLNITVATLFFAFNLRLAVAGTSQDKRISTEPIQLLFEAGKPAYIVSNPKTVLETSITQRLTDYLTNVLHTPARIASDIFKVPAGMPVIFLSSDGNKKISSSSPEAFTISTNAVSGHPSISATGKTALGLKHAIQKIILKSEQKNTGLVIPVLNVSESPWILKREWTLCPWAPDLVRGAFHNPNADKRLNIWLYGDQQLADYVNMYDAFGFSGCQLMETVANYSIMGSADAFRDRQIKLAKAVRANGQDVTLWVWAAQFNNYGWLDPSISYTPAPGHSAFTDPTVRAGFESYYNGYAKMAPYVDMLITHFYDPGSLKDRSDVFKYMRLLLNKFKAKNPKVQLGVDFWAADSDSAYMKELIDNGFSDALLLESSMPHLYPPGKREALHTEAAKQKLKIGVWGWHTAEIETDQNPMMHVNTQLLKHFYQQVQQSADKIHPVSYWSEMEAYHLNNIFSMYSVGQLLWDPGRDPDEILREIAEGIFGKVNGPKILEALKLIEDTRTGPTWNTYWVWSKDHRLGTGNPRHDLQRAKRVIAELKKMQTDSLFVPKFPLPFPPATFVELMIPHLLQIRQFAQSSIDVDEIKDLAKKGTPKQALTKLIQEAWNPIPEYNTWIGMFGQLEAVRQEKMFRELARDLGIEIQEPGWVRWRDSNRVLQYLQSLQRSVDTPYLFKKDSYILSGSFNWPKEKGVDRLQLLISSGCVEKLDDEQYRLANWEEHSNKTRVFLK
jgi:hypothetical protein